MLFYSHESFNQVRVTLIFFCLFFVAWKSVIKKSLWIPQNPEMIYFPQENRFTLIFESCSGCFPDFPQSTFLAINLFFLSQTEYLVQKNIILCVSREEKKKQCLNTDLRAFYGRSVENHFLNCLNLERADLSFFIRE